MGVAKAVGILILILLGLGIWFVFDPYASYRVDVFLVKYLHYDLYHNIMSIYDEATLITLNKSLQQYVGHLIFGDRVPSSDWEKLMMIYRWFKHNLIEDRYGDDWLPPDQIIKMNKSKCTDLAAVAATALVYANVSEVYILCNEIHCVCAVPINGTLYSVDNIKPRPLQNYFNDDHVEGVAIINGSVVKRAIVDLESLREKE